MIGIAAIGGGLSVKILDLGMDIRESRQDSIDVEDGFVSCLGWTQDGQLLTVGTKVIFHLGVYPEPSLFKPS